MIYVGVTRSGCIVADIELIASPIGPEYTGLIDTDSGCRLAEFDRRGRFSRWMGHVSSQRSWHLKEHQFDIVNITSGRRRNESSLKSNGHIAARVGIEFAAGAFPKFKHSDCHGCGAPGQAGDECWACGLGRNGSDKFPHSAKHEGKYGTVRYFLLPEAPTADEIRRQLGLHND